MLIDSHCHLHDREFFSEEQAEGMLTRAKKANVKKIICIGTSHEDSLSAKEFADKHENVYWTYGVHPSEANDLSTLEAANLSTLEATSLSTLEAANLSTLEATSLSTLEAANLSTLEATSLSRSGARPAARKPRAAGATPRAAALRTPLHRDKLVAIGEVGLDYHYDGFDREAQIKLFEEMLQLASDNDLPVSFHIREAFPDFFGVINNFPNIRGVVHSFTDSKKVLKKILNETDFYIGVNGLATYSTLPTPPLERILLETDAPFLTPTPFRGIINEPAYVFEIASWLAQKLGQDYEIIERETTKNARKLFNI